MINRLFRKTWFPLLFQIFMLVAFFFLLIGGLSANTDDMAFAKVLRNTNVANLIVWSYWWPIIILSAILFGRVWCMVCPLELVSSLFSRFGLKRRPPAFLRSGWVIAIFYILILFVGVHTLNIHRVPFRMGLYMLALLAISAACGLLFARNTFCAHVCPVGFLLGLYARLAPFGWGVRDRSLCLQCKDQSCIAAKNAYAFQGRSCGVSLLPASLDDNSECLLCGQCLKACDRNNPGINGRPNPGLFSRRWFKDVLDLKAMTSAQVTFCLVVSGFLIYEIFTEWSMTENLLLSLPSKAEELLGVSGSLGEAMVLSLTLFVALPALFWLLPYAAFRLVGGHLALRDYMLRFGIAFIPLVASAHAIKCLLKMTSRIPYWEHVVGDPIGIITAQGIIDETIKLSALPSWRDPVMTIVSLVLMGGAIALSSLVVRKLIATHLPGIGWRKVFLYLIPVLYGGSFFIMFIAWRLL